MQITSNQHKAVGEIVELIANSTGQNRAIHPATAITTCARLSGSFLFRSFKLDIKNVKPGAAILSEEANIEGPKLINIIMAFLYNLGVTVDNDKMANATIEKSNLEFLAALELTQEKAFQIMKNNQLSLSEMAESCALATAFIIEQCKNDLAAESAFRTAGYSIVEGAKTYPPEMASTSSAKKSWFKFW